MSENLWLILFMVQNPLQSYCFFLTFHSQIVQFHSQIVQICIFYKKNCTPEGVQRKKDCLLVISPLFVLFFNEHGVEDEINLGIALVIVTEVNIKHRLF